MEIVCGEDFALLKTVNGEIYFWGNNNYRCSNDYTMDDYTMDDYKYPNKIVLPPCTYAKKIYANFSSAAMIDNNHNVYVWGENYLKSSEVDFFNNSDDIYEWANINPNPTRIDFFVGKKIENIYCGMFNTFALTHSGDVYFWGLNHTGIMGSGHFNEVRKPTRVYFPDSAAIIKLYAETDHIFAIDKNSNIYSWGRNKNYELCNNNNICQYTPTIATALDGHNVKKIICLNMGTIVLADNKMYSIGSNHNGQLGLGIVETKILTQIRLDTDDAIENIYGDWSTLFCKTIRGNIYAWGLNTSGGLGIGNMIDQNFPVKINIPSGITIESIIYKNGTTYAIATNREIYTWGKNKLASDYPILVPTILKYFKYEDIYVSHGSYKKSARTAIFPNV